MGFLCLDCWKKKRKLSKGKCGRENEEGSKEQHMGIYGILVVEETRVGERKGSLKTVTC